MFKKAIFTAGLLVISYGGDVSAKDFYVEAETIPPAFLPAPPAENSPEWNDEVKKIIAMQAKATPDELKIAESESTLDINAIAPAFDKNFSETSHPKTYSLLKKLGTNCKNIVHIAKDHWKTKRPFMVAKGVRELITPPKSYHAYPSGHTACTRVWAESLAQIMPDKSVALRDKADKSAYYRVIGGMHWLHDVEGGKAIAYLMFGALQQSADYRNDLEAAKAEWQ